MVTTWDNPYWLALTAPQPAYLARIAGFTALFAAAFVAVDRQVSTARAGDTLEGLSSPRRPPPGRSGLTAATNVIATAHALVTSGAAMWVVLCQAYGDPFGWAVSVWQWALAFSQGYFLADAALYGTRREAWVLVHHGWMIIAHHPIGEPLHGCALMGCGDCGRAVWLSATGYWAEISTVFLNIRWFQLRWYERHDFWYLLNSACLLVTYPLMRVVAVPFILSGSLWPYGEEYRQRGLGSLVTSTTVTYSAMVLMSSYYYYTLVSKGLSRVLFFRPEARKRD
mmetsp:Transcript_123422/g.384126  ORF Transcript_123422/g.384126 Transcript_123422/m.384126 type:complete len:282 (+) Transcript_123422:106-951(+)